MLTSAYPQESFFFFWFVFFFFWGGGVCLTSEPGHVELDHIVRETVAPFQSLPHPFTQRGQEVHIYVCDQKFIYTVLPWCDTLCEGWG